jgi:SAM-dependent methyltransferase
MATQSSAPIGNEPNPLLILDALSGFQRATALKAAIELEIFTLIGGGVTTAAELAKRAETSQKGMRILCDFMAIQGFLTKQDGTYGLTPDSAVFLDKKSPAYMGSIAFFLVHPVHIANYMDVTGAVRKGGVVSGQGNMGPDAPIWVDFAEFMAPISAMGSAAMAQIVNTPGQPMKVLDIAAGPGAYGIAIAKLNPKAEIYGVDWKNVLELSMEHARQAGVGDRYHGIAGSAFDVDLGSGYDLILLPNFLHHFDHATNVKLLERMRAALKPNGRVATVEFVPNDDRISPPMAAGFSMMMLGSTEGGDAYTFKELDAMFRDAGFRESTPQELGPETLILTKY